MSRFLVIILWSLAIESMYSQNMVWRREVNITGDKDVSMYFRNFGNDLFYFENSLYLNSPQATINSSILVDTLGKIRNLNLRYYSTDSVFYDFRWRSRYNQIFCFGLKEVSFGVRQARFKILNQDLSKNTLKIPTSENSFYVFGNINSILLFKNQYAFLLGKRGNFSFEPEIKNYWMKVDTGMNIIAQNDRAHMTRDNPFTFCWGHDKKIKAFCHGIFYMEEDSLSLSTFTIDTAGAISPKTKIYYPGFSRKLTTTSDYPSFIYLQPTLNKQYIAAYAYTYSSLSSNTSHIAVLDSTLTKVLRTKRLNNTVIKDLRVLQNGNIVLLEDFFTSNINGKIEILDSAFNEVYSNLDVLPLAGMDFFNGKDLMFITRGLQPMSIFIGRINNVGYPYELNPYPGTDSILTQKEPTFSKAEFRLLPNPAQDYFWLEGAAEPAHLCLYDAKGSKMFEELVPPLSQVDISWLKNGIYYWRANGKQTVGKGFLIKN